VREAVAAKLIVQRRPRYVEAWEAYLECFIHGREEIHFPQFTSADVEAWFDGRREAPASRATGLARLSTLFSFAVRRG
jgi:hypothetical protein